MKFSFKADLLAPDQHRDTRCKENGLAVSVANNPPIIFRVKCGKISRNNVASYAILRTHVTWALLFISGVYHAQPDAKAFASPNF